MTEKRYVSDVKNTEKEVRIFDLEAEKKIFNIFFNELDSAICLNGALGDIITRLNEQNETIMTYKAIINKQEMQLSELEYNQQKVKDTLQKGKDLVEDGYTARELLKSFAVELGIDLQ